MARKLNPREKVLLTGLAIAAVAYVAVLFFRDAPGATDNGSEKAADAASTDAPTVMMALLTRAPDDYDADGRDLFKYAKRPESLQERLEREARERAEAERLRRLQEEAASRQKEQQERKPAVATVAAPARPRVPVPPRVDFDYLGYLGPKDDRIAVFEDGDRLLLARIGEVLEDDFLVKEIGYQKVVIGFTGDQFKDQTTELSMRTQ